MENVSELRPSHQASHDEGTGLASTGAGRWARGGACLMPINGTRWLSPILVTVISLEQRTTARSETITGAGATLRPSVLGKIFFTSANTSLLSACSSMDMVWQSGVHFIPLSQGSLSDINIAFRWRSCGRNQSLSSQPDFPHIDTGQQAPEQLHFNIYVKALVQDPWREKRRKRASSTSMPPRSQSLGKAVLGFWLLCLGFGSSLLDGCLQLLMVVDLQPRKRCLEGFHGSFDLAS